MSPTSRSTRRSEPTRRCPSFLAAAFPAAALATACAHATPASLAARDARVAVFRYRANRIYTIPTLAGAVTDIALAAGERPLTFALGDTVRWIVARDDGDIFIKPVRAGLFTSATLVTNERRYELLLLSVPPGKPWDEEVRWRVPPPLVLFRGSASPPVARAAPPVPASPPRVDTRFVIRGRASWRPREVYALGHTTYLVFRRHAQTLPALFLVRHGRAVLVNYAVAGRTIVYPGLFRRAVLVLGRRRVRIRRLP